VIEDCILKAGPLPYEKWWWSSLLTAKCVELHRLLHRAYSTRMEPGDPVYLEHRAVRRAYRVLIYNTKRVFWEGFLALLNKRLILTAHQYASGNPTDRGQARIPPLKGGQASMGMATGGEAETNKDKSRLLHTTFFPELGRLT